MAHALGSQGLSLDLNLQICCEKFASLWLVAWTDALDFLRPRWFYLQMEMGKHIPWGAGRVHTSCQSGTLESLMSLMRIWLKSTASLRFLKGQPGACLGPGRLRVRLYCPSLGLVSGTFLFRNNLDLNSGGGGQGEHLHRPPGHRLCGSSPHLIQPLLAPS